MIYDKKYQISILGISNIIFVFMVDIKYSYV